MEFLGLNRAEIASLDELCARVLARVCEAAVAHRDRGRGRLVHFRELPRAVMNWLPTFFGMERSEADLAKMGHVTQFNAKTPALAYEDDSEAKRSEATAELKELARCWIAGPYERLGELRAAQTSATSQ
jgi:hypothetical protein